MKHPPRRWKTLRSNVYQHTPYLHIEDVIFELPNGKEERFSLVHGQKVVCALALTEDRRIILARQFRPGPNEVLDELPGGRRDPGETPEEAVLRELREETGYAPSRLIPLGRFYEGAYSQIERLGFLALDCRQVGEPEPDEHEFLEVILKPLHEFSKQIRRGLCTDVDIAWAALYEAGLVTLPKED